MSPSSPILCALVVIACTMSAVYAGQCTNEFAIASPVSIPSSQSGPPLVLNLLNISVANPGSYCKDQGQLCCSPDALAGFARQLNLGTTALDVAIGRAKSQIDQAAKQVDSIPFPDDTKKAINHLIKIAPDLLEASKNCMLAFMTYFEGLLCLACRTTAGSYYNAAKMELYLAQNTCDQMAGVCMGIIDIVNDVKKDALTILQTLGQTIPAEAQKILSSDQNLCEAVDPNDHNCHNLICNNLKGITLPNTSSLIPPNGGGMPNFPFPSSMPSMPSMPPSDGSDSGSSGFGPNSFLTNLASFSADPEVLAQQIAAFVLDAAPASTKNVYTSDGYDAYESGCSSGLTTAGCPRPASKLSPVALGLIIGGSVLVFLLVVFLCCRYRKKKAAAEANALPYMQPNAPAADAQPYQPYRPL